MKLRSTTIDINELIDKILGINGKKNNINLMAIMKKQVGMPKIRIVNVDISKPLCNFTPVLT